jgi:excisionase family DNA binding protein
VTERLLTPRDVADRCQVSTKTVLRAIHRGRLRASRLGEQGAYRMRADDVDVWIESSVVDIPAPRSAPALARLDPTTGRLFLTADMGRARRGEPHAPGA